MTVRPFKNGHHINLKLLQKYYKIYYPTYFKLYHTKSPKTYDAQTKQSK